LNIRTVLLVVFAVLTIAFASVAISESPSKPTVTSTTTVIQTTTQTFVVTTGVASPNYPVTFLVTPSQCSIQGLCVNATLVDNIGENLSVILAAWVKNATTGQNVTLAGNGKGPMGYSSCVVNASIPKSCYLVTYPFVNTATYEVTVFVLSIDGKTVLSPQSTITVSLH
jgi:hypothetical protein